MTLRRVTKRSWRIFQPPVDIGLTDWADKYAYLPAELSERHGRYRSSLTPYMRGIHAALADRDVEDIVCMKAAQVGWTVGAVIQYILWTVCTAPRNIIVMFPRDRSASEFVHEKFNPVVDATPAAREKVTTSFSRKDGNKEVFRKFAGGWMKFIGSNSAAAAKSSSAPIVIFEEPDDANVDIQGQGGAMRLLKERTKTFRRARRIRGGTPTLKGLSAIEYDYGLSDQRKFFVPCHDCGEAHVLAWEHVHWPEDADIAHEVYGRARPDEAAYTCPGCGSLWRDLQKNRNVAAAEARGFGWKATAPYQGVVGFHVSELKSPFPGSAFSVLARKFLEAEHKQKQGDLSDMIAFYNNQLGEAYEYSSDAPSWEKLQARAEDYAEGTVPERGLALVATIDVQHDRFAVKLIAFGPGEESWLVLYTEIHGVVPDSSDPVWKRLDEVAFSPYPHASGGALVPMTAEIDSSDGQTNDNVYKWVRRNQRRGARALKGDSWEMGRTSPSDREIYSRPKPVDHKSDTKASRYGLQVYLVGTQRAKDLIAERLKLEGDGPGRMHWYDAGEGYFRQMLSEVKAPDRRRGGRLTWQQRRGEANEALDCEVYAVHAARRLRLHTRPQSWWDAQRQLLLQTNLFNQPPVPVGGSGSPWSGWRSDQ